MLMSSIAVWDFFSLLNTAMRVQMEKATSVNEFCEV